MWNLGRQRPAYRSMSCLKVFTKQKNKMQGIHRERERERERGEEQEAMKLLLEVALFLVCLGSRGVFSEQHRYEVGDPVPFYANVVSPFHNPSETYPYFDLPFCSSENVSEIREALGDFLTGHRLVESPYKTHFRISHSSKLLCKKKLTKEDVARFRSVIAKDYYFQMYFDDLPIWAFLGSVRSKWKTNPMQYFLYRHVHLDIFYNNHRVIEINVQTDANEVVDITEDREIEVEFTYSVMWRGTRTPFEKRMDTYLQSASMRYHHQVQWFSTMNSCVIVLLLTGFLATILMRVIKNDLIKYTNDVESADGQDETGWKNIHGDIFRFPENKSLFAACIGSGTQLLALTFLTFIFALLGLFRPYSRGAPFTAIVVLYAFTSIISGYISTSFYLQLEGTNWVKNVLLTGCLFSGPFFITFCFLNTVAIMHGATAALTFGTIVIVVLIYTLLSTPLLLLGAIAGKIRSTEFQAPCRTTKCPREIPPLPWYRRTISQMAMAGILPFCAIFIELHYLFASLWGHRIYTMYNILFTVFIVLLLVTAFITVTLTYFQLAAEDHRWWWRSLLTGGSTGLYVYGYCIYYRFARTYMWGVMQTSFFFGYMACICYGFFLMLGTVGFYASLLFVRRIYGSIKCE